MLARSRERLIRDFYNKVEFNKVARKARVNTQIKNVKEEYKELLQEFLKGFIGYEETSDGELVPVYDPNKFDRIAMCKEIEDCIYVLIGLAIDMGFKSDEAFNAIHESNMSKIKYGILKNEYGKILKGPHYQPANLEEFV